MALAHRNRCSRESRLESRFLGFVSMSDLTIMLDVPFAFSPLIAYRAMSIGRTHSVRVGFVLALKIVLLDVRPLLLFGVSPSRAHLSA